MAKAILNKYGIATEAGNITVYNYDSKTREYLSSAVEFLAIGVGIPDHSCTDAPVEKKEGFAVCRTASLDGWEYITDHRGETVYDKQTGQPVELTALGDYPDSITAIAPLTPYDRWNGGKWVTDEGARNSAEVLAAEKKKNALLAEAKNTISLWQTALQLGIISDEDKTSLIAWMNYIKGVQAVNTDNVQDIKWPVHPEAWASQVL